MQKATGAYRLRWPFVAEKVDLLCYSSFWQMDFALYKKQFSLGG